MCTLFFFLLSVLAIKSPIKAAADAPLEFDQPRNQLRTPLPACELPFPFPNLGPEHRECALLTNAILLSHTSPLTPSILMDNTPGLKALIAAKVDVNKANSHGVTPLMLAAKYLNEDAARELLQARAHVSLRDPQGLTAFNYASGSFEKENFLQRRNDLIALLKEASQEEASKKRSCCFFCWKKP